MEYRENRDARRPFLATPDSRVYFPASAIERARRTTERCLRRGEGIALVVGATGVGKTILSRVLAASFEAEDLVVVASPSRKVDVKSFLQQILFGLRQTFCGCDETELRLMTLDYLERSQRRRLMLIVDDAQNLSLRVFDEIRVLVDQGPALASQISVALVGTGLLEERLNLPRFYPIQQRIAARSYLDVFERAEISDYIDREMERVGSIVRFSSDAKDAIVEFSAGSPRVVNQLSDRALVLASDGRDGETVVREIGREFVERAWANLQNIPEDDDEKIAVSPSASSDVVEFGTLDDEDDDFENERANGSVAAVGDSSAEVRRERFDESETAGDAPDETAEFAPAPVEKKIDWEAERYGNFDEESSGGSDDDEENAQDKGIAEDKGSAENADVEEDAESAEADASTEIDAELEARLLSKFATTAAGDSAERAESTERNDAANDESDKIVEDVKNENVVQNVESDDRSETNGGADERNLERKVFDALKSDDFDPAAVDGRFASNQTTSESNDSADFAALFSRAKTRRPLRADDDGSREFEAVNGFSIDDATGASVGERFWEANLSPEAVSEQTIYSDGFGRDFVEGTRFASANSDGEYVELEELAYRQIVEACNQTVNDAAANDQCLTELRLLEQEIEEEANLVRKIRNIHLRLRAVRGERTLEQPENVAETSRFSAQNHQ